MFFVMFVCLFDYVFVTFISKYFYLLFVCFIHVFSLELVHGRSLRLVELMKEAFQAKGCKLGVFTSRQPLHESPPFLAVSSRQSLHDSSPFLTVSSHQPLHESSPILSVSSLQPFTSCHLPFSVKSCNFLALSSFRILDIILCNDVQIEWLKLIWKDNTEYYYNFHEGTFQK